MGEAGGVTDGRFRLREGGGVGWSVLHHFLNQFYSFNFDFVVDFKHLKDRGWRPWTVLQKNKSISQ